MSLPPMRGTPLTFSSVFVEANEVGMLSEASSADHKLVLSDQTVSGVADSASSGVLTELSGVTVQLVGHLLYRTLTLY